MKKILLLINDAGFKAATLDFAAYIAKSERSNLTGLFVAEQLPDLSPSSKGLSAGIYEETLTQSIALQQQIEARMQGIITDFLAGCSDRGVDGLVERHRSHAMENIMNASRYADLIIVDPSISFTEDSSYPSAFATDIFHHAECPVLITPENFVAPKEIILAYDGSRSSVFAIKQFCHLLPALAQKKVVVLHINNNHSADEAEENLRQFNQWLRLRFNTYEYLELKGDPREELFKHFLQYSADGNKLLVMGAFGRGILSSLFRKSTAELVLKVIDIPIFIAHH